MDLPAGHTWRRATPDDVAAICALVIACDVAEYGEPDYEEADVRDDFARERFDLARDTWVVENDKTLVGYAATWDKRPHELILGDAFSHPDGVDLQPWLVARVDERAREHAEASGATTIHSFNSEPNTLRAKALTDAGYAVCRVFRRMVIDLDVPPPLPSTTPGVVIRHPTDDDLRTCYDVEHVAFREHFDHTDESYDAWLARRKRSPHHDLGLWWLAEVDGVPAGVLIGEWHDDNGWVKSLGVLREARGRGVGTALLLTAFDAFRKAGAPKVGLGVDSDNSTGAMALYERIGMRAEHRYDCYEKVVTRS